MDSPGGPAQHQVHTHKLVHYKGAESAHQSFNLGASFLRALRLHDRSYLQAVRGEVGEARLVLRGCVLAIEIIFLSVLDMARENRLGERRTLTSL